MVFLMARLEAGPLWPKMPKGRVGKQLYEAKGHTENRHSDSRKRANLLFIRRMMKRAGVIVDADDDDADEVRTSVS